MNFCAHFGHTRPHPFAADGDVAGDPDPPDAQTGGVGVPPQVVPGPIAAEPAPRNSVGPIVDGDDATSNDASSSHVLSLTSYVVDNDSSEGVHSVTIID